MKNLLNVEGAQQLTKSEQRSINGGHNCIYGCPTHLPGCKCVSGVCQGPIYCHVNR
ncbi:hypothetical protein [Psychroserpens luteolus]|uniref:hypothetical protein n=1 Tax=Psychroserpens luteolus TaxID=2855840 RepID=UPI001E605214|nr:hypothetical protein [Psychroserpens luteolus]MCD2258646.1 hypothetical protein [Psychroserpens luteolus]